MPLDPGTTLGPYQVTAKIGEGAMEYQHCSGQVTILREQESRALAATLGIQPRASGTITGPSDGPRWCPPP